MNTPIKDDGSINDDGIPIRSLSEVKKKIANKMTNMNFYRNFVSLLLYLYTAAILPLRLI